MKYYFEEYKKDYFKVLYEMRSNYKSEVINNE